MAKFDPKKADLNKDGTLSDYESNVGQTRAAAMEMGHSPKKMKHSPMKKYGNGYAMKMGSKEVNSPSAFNMKDAGNMADSPMMNHHEIKLDGVTVKGNKLSSKSDEVAQYKANLKDLSMNITNEILGNIHRPDSTMASINNAGITYKERYDHRKSTDYTSSNPNSRGGRNNIYMSTTGTQNDGAPKFNFRFSKDSYHGKKGDIHYGSESGKSAMIRQYDKLASEKYKEGKAKIQLNYPKLNFGSK